MSSSDKQFKNDPNSVYSLGVSSPAWHVGADASTGVGLDNFLVMLDTDRKPDKDRAWS